MVSADRLESCMRTGSKTFVKLLMHFRKKVLCDSENVIAVGRVTVQCSQGERRLLSIGAWN